MKETCRIDFEEREHGIQCAHVVGVRSVASTEDYWEAIIERVVKARPAALLVEDELVGEEMSASEWKRVVSKVAGHGLEGIPIAHVKPFSFDQISYCEKYANEAGLVARAFRRVPEASDWLRAHIA